MNDDKSLLKIFKGLDGPSRQSLLDFAQYLDSRPVEGAVSDQTTVTIEKPLEEVAPKGETVIAAIKRMRRVYYMLDVGELFNQASSLVTSNIVGGRKTTDVIIDIEALFAKYYQAYLNNIVTE